MCHTFCGWFLKFFGWFGNFTIICWSSIRNYDYKYVSTSTGIPNFSGSPVSAAQRSTVLLKVGSVFVSRNIYALMHRRARRAVPTTFSRKVIASLAATAAPASLPTLRPSMVWYWILIYQYHGQNYGSISKSYLDGCPRWWYWTFLTSSKHWKLMSVQMKVNICTGAFANVFFDLP